MRQLSILAILLAISISGCKQEVKKSISTIEVNVTNHKLLDSLIIYDKEMSWEKKSILRFNSTNKVLDTMNIVQNKFYQIYSFINGVQSELGELILSKDSEVTIAINENRPFESIHYTGDFELSNNFLAYSKNHQNQLSEVVKNGIKQEDLEILIQKKDTLIKNEGVSLNVVDTLGTYVDTKFSDFTNILKKKNTKYLYKASLINEIGNNFSFTDIDNNPVSLKDFYGKYIYIDVWATWCKPCKVEYVFLKELEEYFSNNDKLQIISISTDREFKKWDTYIKEKSIKGMQLYSGEKSDFVKFYDIGALPRFILLNKEGQIISPDEIRPSNSELLKKLESLVNKND
jgi:thiol-disulfide isomerase/thioredoxin